MGGGWAGVDIWPMGIQPSNFLPAGDRASGSTPILWFWDYERGAPSRLQDTSSVSFFKWLSEHTLPGSGKIAEVILLWPGPGKVMVEAPRAWKADLADWSGPPLPCVPSQIICEDLWPNPLQYYAGPRGGSLGADLWERGPPAGH